MRNWNAFVNSEAIKSDIICVQETWKINNPQYVTLDEFEPIIYRPRLTGKGGGVAIYIRKGIRYKRIDTVYRHGVIESVGIEIELNGKKYNIYSVYRIPNSGTLGISLLMEELAINKSYIIMGDININSLKITAISRTYKRLCRQNGLKQIINGITRQARRTCIDHALITKTLANVSSGAVIMEEVADHFITKVTLGIMNNFKPYKDKVIEYREINNNNLNSLRTKLNMVNWQEIDSEDIDPSNDTEQLITILRDKLDECCPKIRRKFNVNKDRQNNWMTTELLELRSHCKKLVKKAVEGDKIASLRYKLEFKKYKRKLNIAKDNYMYNSIKEAGSDGKKNMEFTE